LALSQREQDQLASGRYALIVVGLCAAWCGTCREFEETFARLRQSHPQILFVWLDIEDDSALAGDIDVENFPSLAVYRRGKPVFYGVTEPQHGLVERLIMALSDAPEQIVPEEVANLYQQLLDRRSGSQQAGA
jgi:thioredoxin reductase (NADPH)